MSPKTGRSWSSSPTQSGSSDIRLKDLLTGKETPLTSSPASELYPKISPDGSVVAYEIRRPERKPEIFTVPASGGLPISVCGGCGTATDWNSRGIRDLDESRRPLR